MEAFYEITMEQTTWNAAIFLKIIEVYDEFGFKEIHTIKEKK